jgi:putative copper export protein
MNLLHAASTVSAASTASTGPQLSSAVDGIRLALHVLAASIWVGGQFTMAGLLPTARGIGADAPKKLARALSVLLWPAFVVLVLTGFWNISAITLSGQSTAWKAVLIVKLVVVVIAGVGVYLHQRSTTKRATALWASVGGLASVAALVMGVFLAG